MRTKLILTLIVAGLCGRDASAVNVTNLRASYGPLGAKRADAKYLPGDAINLSFDIQDIKVEAKTGIATYQTIMEILDDAGKPLVDGAGKPISKPQESPNMRVVLLGGTEIRTTAFALLGTAQAAGKYKLKITVKDKLAEKEKSPQPEKSIVYDFEVLPQAFGIVQPNTAALAMAGSDFTVGFSLVGMKPNEKTKLPEVEVVVRVLDEAGKELTTKPWTIDVAGVFHNPPVVDLREKTVVPVYLTFALNRPGTFTIQVDAEDKIGKEKTQMKFPLKVIDLPKLIGG